MDKDLQRIEGKIDALTDVVGFMKDRMITKDGLKAEVEKLATKEETNGKFAMLEGHMNVIEQKLDNQIETHKGILARVTTLETKAFTK